MEIRIPMPEEVNEDLKDMILSLARTVISEAKEREDFSKPYMNTVETGKYIGCSFTTLQKYQSLGLKSIAIEGKRLFKKETIDAFLKSYEK